MIEIQVIREKLSSFLNNFGQWQIALFSSSLAALIVDVYLLLNSSGKWMLIISAVCVALGTLLSNINKLFYLAYLVPLALRVLGIIGLLPYGEALGINSGDLFLTANMMVITALIPLVGAVFICTFFNAFATKKN